MSCLTKVKAKRKATKWQFGFHRRGNNKKAETVKGGGFFVRKKLKIAHLFKTQDFRHTKISRKNLPAGVIFTII